MMVASSTLDQALPGRALRRAIVPIGITQLIAWGSTYYLPAVLKERFTTELGLSEMMVFAGVATTLIVAALLAWPMGKLLDRTGAGRVLPFGSFFLGLGLVIMGLSGDWRGYFAAWTLFGIGMSMAMSNAVFAALAQMAGQGARRAIVIIMLFGGMAATIFWPLTLWLDGLVGWRNACFFYASLHLFVCLPLHVIFVSRATDSASRQDLREDEAPGVIVPEQRRKAGLLLFVVVSGNGFVSWGLDLHLIRIFGEYGLPTALAVGVAAMKGPAMMLARLSDIVVAGRISPLRSALVGCLLVPSGLSCALLLAKGLPAAMIFIVVYSFGTGLMTVARATLALSLLGAQGYAVVMGKLTLPTQIVYAVAPMAFSLIIGAIGTNGALSICLLFSFASLLAVLGLSRLIPRRAS